MGTNLTIGKIGLITPVLTLNVGTHAPWERSGTVEDVAEIARAAERLGFDHLTCCEHVGIPSDVEPIRGGRYFDPLSTFGYLAAITTRIRFVTYVLVLGYHHPLEVAKRYGTLDLLSGGRLILGVGVGSLRPEFALLGLDGAPFEERGRRADDAMRALRASFGKRMPEYQGPYYSFSDFIIDPCGVQTDIPLWVGGRSLRSLRRAVELGDGWIPFSLSANDLGRMVGEAKSFRSWSARSKPLELIFRNEGVLDPIGDPRGTADAIAQLFRAGATRVDLSLSHRSRSHYIEQIEAVAAMRLETQSVPPT